VGVPSEDVLGGRDAGAVYIIFGSEQGLGRGQRTVRLTQGTMPNTGAPEAGDRFGASLAIGIDGELAVGAPGEDLGAIKDAGAVLFLDTSFGNYDNPPTQFITQSRVHAGRSEPGDHFGAALAWSADTLVIGLPGEDVGCVVDAGAVVATDRSNRMPQFFSQNTAGMGGTSERGDRFGSALQGLGVSGAGTGASTIAIGVPGEDIRRTASAGLINFITPTKRGPLRPDRLALSQDTAKVPGGAEADDHLGSVLASRGAGLWVGVPDEDIGRVPDAGAVLTLNLEWRKGRVQVITA